MLYCFLAKASGVVTSLPIVGGITASGVFLLFLAIIGLFGVIRNHQVILYFYMIVLILVFILQFSCSCAALSISKMDQTKLVKSAWEQGMETDVSLMMEVERQLDCCGLGLNATHAVVRIPDTEDHEWATNNRVFTGEWADNECAKPPIFDAISGCQTCILTLLSKVKLSLKYISNIQIQMYEILHH